MPESSASAHPIAPLRADVDAASPLSSVGAGRDAPGEVSLLWILTVLLRRRWLIVGLAVASGAAAAALVTLRDPAYTATARFIPQTRERAEGLSALASQFGISTGGSSGAESPDFYADLVRSRTVLGALVDERWAIAEAGRDSVTLMDWFEVDEPTPALRRDAAIRELSERVASSVDTKTGTVRVGVETGSPVLSHSLATRIIELVNEFNLERRQTRASQERRFTEQRLAEVRAAALQTERRLQEFMQRNRVYANSPALQFEQERLARDVSQAQSLVTTLSQAYEESRIEEVRDSPVITVIEPSQVPVREDPRGRVAKTIIAAFFGALLGAGIALAGAALSAARRVDRAAYSEFEAARRELGFEVRHPIRALARRARR